MSSSAEPKPTEAAAPAVEEKKVEAAAAPAAEEKKGPSASDPDVPKDVVVMALQASKEHSKIQTDAISALQRQLVEAQSRAEAAERNYRMVKDDAEKGVGLRKPLVTKEGWNAEGQVVPERSAILDADRMVTAAKELGVEAGDDVREMMEKAPAAARSFMASMAVAATNAVAEATKAKETAASKPDVHEFLRNHLAEIRAESQRQFAQVTAAAPAPEPVAAPAKEQVVGVHAREAHPDMEAPSGKRRRASPDDGETFVPKNEMIVTRAGCQLPDTNVSLRQAALQFVMNRGV